MMRGVETGEVGKRDEGESKPWAVVELKLGVTFSSAHCFG